MSTPITLFASGDFLAGISLIYTNILGPLFYGVLVFMVIYPIYAKTQNVVLPAVLAILLAGAFEAVIPAPVIVLARFFVILTVATGLFLIFTRGR